MNKIFTILVISFNMFSCEKKYSCVCYSEKNKRDTLISSVYTTNLGYKGYKISCENKNLTDSLSNCQIK